MSASAAAEDVRSSISPHPGETAVRLEAAQRLVIKVGSALLIDETSGTADSAWMAMLAEDLARLAAQGRRVLVVSSGAVALGRRRLGLPPRGKLDLQTTQAAASAGQSLLMRVWEEALAPHGLTAAQVLLTRDDTEIRRRWLNGRATLDRLLDLRAMPVVNENDAVATGELRYGDNDRLAARVAQMVRAEVLVLLSDVDGLYTADPRAHPNARHVQAVDTVTRAVEAMAGGANAEAATGCGGMATKLAAARIAQAGRMRHSDRCGAPRLRPATSPGPGRRGARDGDPPERYTARRLQAVDRGRAGAARDAEGRRRCGASASRRAQPAAGGRDGGDRRVRQGRSGAGA